MLDHAIEWLTPLFQDWGLLIVFVATFLESGVFVASVVPGETVLLLGGFFSSRQAVAAATGAATVVAEAPLDVRHVIALAFVGALLGDLLGYLIGRLAGRALLRRFGRFVFLPERRLPLLERYVNRYGARAMFFGRFAPFLRSVRTLVAGIARMPFPRFVLPNVLGAAAWASGIVLAGYLLGESWRVARRYLGAGGLAAFLLLVALFVFTWRRARRRFERELLEAGGIKLEGNGPDGPKPDPGPPVEGTGSAGDARDTSADNP